MLRLNTWLKLKKIHNLYQSSTIISRYYYSMENKQYTPEELEEQLKKLGIEYTLHKHEAAFNMQELKERVKLNKAPYIKNIFSKDKKNDCYLISAHVDTVVGKAFYKKVGTSYSNCRMADGTTLKEKLGVEAGSVTPFGLINDHKKGVKEFIIDQNLLKEEYLAFHPLVNTSTIELKTGDFFKFLESIGRTYKSLDLSEVEEKTEAPKTEKQEKPKAPVKEEKKADTNETKLSLACKKSEDFSGWYSDVLKKGELIEYYEISGCYILRPYAYGIWETIQKLCNTKFDELGVENSYFPLFVTQRALFKEKEHVDGFSPEVAWVTKYSDTNLKEPIAIRPTSETIMYDAYAKWIKSHRDLPLKLNQWTNVVRWEFKDPTPFIRTREFLWQEGHTAHATKEEADVMTYDILELYRHIYEDNMAVPVIKGVKTETERFPGALYTTTVEAYIPGNFRAVQASTSHQLGQNFAKMFNIEFLDEHNQKQLVWQTSWAITTRSIGIMIMVHGDDQGLVMPPRVAHIQVVIVPIIQKETDSKELIKKCKELGDKLKAAGIKVKVDDRDNYSPGWKYNHWELKGVPLRLELGPKDFAASEVRAVQRVDGKKYQLKWDGLEQSIATALTDIHNYMFAKAKETRDSRLKHASNWEEFMGYLNQGCIVLTPWCMDDKLEAEVKVKTGNESKEDENSHFKGNAKTLCIPLEQEPIKEGEVCFYTGRPALKRVLWGRSY